MPYSPHQQTADGDSVEFASPGYPSVVEGTNYCTANWCTAEETSIFIYAEGDDHGTYDLCGAVYAGPVLPDVVPSAIAEVTVHTPGLCRGASCTVNLFWCWYSSGFFFCVLRALVASREFFFPCGMIEQSWGTWRKLFSHMTAACSPASWWPTPGNNPFTRMPGRHPTLMEECPRTTRDLPLYGSCAATTRTVSSTPFSPARRLARRRSRQKKPTELSRKRSEVRRGNTVIMVLCEGSYVRGFSATSISARTIGYGGPQRERDPGAARWTAAIVNISRDPGSQEQALQIEEESWTTMTRSLNGDQRLNENPCQGCTRSAVFLSMLVLCFPVRFQHCCGRFLRHRIGLVSYVVKFDSHISGEYCMASTPPCPPPPRVTANPISRVAHDHDSDLSTTGCTGIFFYASFVYCFAFWAR